MSRRFYDPDSADSRREKSELETFLSKVKDNGLPVGIVMFPTLVEVGGQGINYPFGFLFERVLEACDRYSIQCLDLRSVYAKASPASRLWANELDSHPGAYANSLAADAILEKYRNEWN